MTTQDMGDGFKRHILFRPSYDHRDDRSNQRGANGLEIHFGLQGPKGAISASIGTGWVPNPISDPTWNIYASHKPIRQVQPGVDVNAHDIYPMGQVLASHIADPDGDRECEWLEGGKCSDTNERCCLCRCQLPE